MLSCVATPACRRRSLLQSSWVSYPEEELRQARAAATPANERHKGAKAKMKTNVNAAAAKPQLAAQTAAAKLAQLTLASPDSTVIGSQPLVPVVPGVGEAVVQGPFVIVGGCLLYTFTVLYSGDTVYASATASGQYNVGGLANMATMNVTASPNPQVIHLFQLHTCFFHLIQAARGWSSPDEEATTSP